MMKKANVGKPKDQWKPPEGYKSALGKARDLARAAEKKNKKVAALESGSDTASDDDCDFGGFQGRLQARHFAGNPAALHLRLHRDPQHCEQRQPSVGLH